MSSYRQISYTSLIAATIGLSWLNAARAELTCQSFDLGGGNHYMGCVYHSGPEADTPAETEFKERSGALLQREYLQRGTLGVNIENSLRILQQAKQIDARTYVVTLFPLGTNGIPDFESPVITLKAYTPENDTPLPIKEKIALLPAWEARKMREALGAFPEQTVEVGNLAKDPNQWTPVRSLSVAIQLLSKAVSKNTNRPYRQIVIDTQLIRETTDPAALRRRSGLSRLYRALGFKDVVAYQDPKLPGMTSVFMTADYQGVMQRADSMGDVHMAEIERSKVESLWQIRRFQCFFQSLVDTIGHSVPVTEPVAK